MMRVCVLGSGSSGNATFVEHNGTRLLLDAGLGAKEIVVRLSAIGVDAASLSAIFISHEHQDHIQGAAPISRKFKVPVFISQRALEHSSYAIQHIQHLPLQAEIPVQIGGVTVTPFSTPHDSVDPLAFALKAGNSRMCVVSDLGHVTETVRSRLQAVDLLVIESNHDLEMLRTGPYPWPLKQRVMSNFGHLSNEALSYFFAEYFDGTERKVILTHLSRQNNHPQLAFVAATRGLEKRSRDTAVYVSLQDEISECVEI